MGFSPSMGRPCRVFENNISMIKQEDVYQIGRMGKAHGLKGEINFQFTDDLWDRTDCDYLICEVEGILVPFFIEEYRFRSDSTAIMKLDGIDNVEAVQMLVNSPFALRHVPCIFFENEEGDAFKYYHTVHDTYDNFLTDTYEPLFRLITSFINQY